MSPVFLPFNLAGCPVSHDDAAMPEESPAVLLVFCTFPDETVAHNIATTLVEEELVACVNLNPAVTSIYRWEGKVETAGEVLAQMKTTPAAYDALEARLQALHPYDVPEILAMPVERGLPAYLRWVEESVSGQ
ncbi:divalent-cation tolerance protein CutA [Verrucomicrobium sp. BvORR034]|uniref:divalent-cation tolerance protein CutA n=1 Tax=Verrucomicrobium sp. BvORR034 TaxID=1396418 RepID=UPI002240F031|nr:divalent-cation tolerance protein CutA [Verrucomicrobium sp. BvORR034]